MNGVWGSTGQQWFTPAPTAIPFAGARSTNDGFYNPWAALFYNNSDAYGFAFSDRSGPSPLMTLQDGQTLRITLLPDSRLDSPKPYVSKATSDSLTIKWPAITGATQYKIEVLAPSDFGSIPPVSGTSHTLSSLQPGTPYTFKVSALGAGSIESPAQIVQGITDGSPSQITGNIDFPLTFSWKPTSLATAAAIVKNGEIDKIVIENSGYGYSSAPAVTVTSGGAVTTGSPVLNSKVVSFVEVTNEGSGYTGPPSVTISGGSGSLATGTALVGEGKVTQVLITNPGTNYQAPTVSFTGGGGQDAAALAHVTGGAIDAIRILDPGSNYTTAPTVTISAPGTGTQATATAIIVDGKVQSVTINQAGTGYQNSPTATITAPGSGTQATARVWVSPGNAITSVTVPTPGTGYVAPTITFGAPGSGAVAAAIVDDTGKITGVHVIAGGSGFTSAPTVTITGGNGSGAAATAVSDGSAVTGVVVTNGGSGYQPTPQTNVTDPGGGAGANLIPLCSQRNRQHLCDRRWRQWLHQFSGH